ncbi:MAG: DUF721 domain-containing protein [Chloroherpetonaceae bacterium]|nr:DUF721 domain-containing protein [Chloroherpetonaceae bacterium]
MQSATRILESLALACWSRAVGPQAAAATQPEAVRDGILFVRTRSSVWSHELTFHKARILHSLNCLLGAPIIQDIVFRAQGVPTVERTPEQEAPSMEELQAVVLDPAEKAELRSRLHALISIKDNAIRTRIARCVALDARLRHWRLERGWRVCPKCGATHKTDYPVCPICRLNA